MPSPKTVRTIGSGFDRVAFIYDRIVNLVFGRSITDLQARWISTLPEVDHLLIVGGGTGKILENLIQQKKAKHYCYAEASNKMLKRSKHRLGGEGNVHFTNTWDMQQHYDAILLPFVLDCYPEKEVEELILQFETVLSEDGYIAILDFNHDPRFGFEVHPVKQGFISLLYAFFGALGATQTRKLPAIFFILDNQGWKEQEHLSHHQGWLVANHWTKKAKA